MLVCFLLKALRASRCTVALNQGGKEEIVVQDDFNERLATPMSNWWTGETYFDLQGRDPGELKVAVAAARKGKPIRQRPGKERGQEQSFCNDR